ncbi:MAG: T9SS C-terminal target domain-containing protein [Balneolaceae bacterium]|nr:MAG: T9SS C-terminal target domain-containing protein [Balneolaceae bacterium]
MIFCYKPKILIQKRSIHTISLSLIMLAGFFFNTQRLLAQQHTIALNEVMASNSVTFADEDGDYEDWIEIYNYGDEPVNLNGFGLSDDEDRPFRWVFPEVIIEPDEYLLVWASNKDRRETSSELHTNFRIASSGEKVLLTYLDGTLIDILPPTKIPTDISLGRQPDGSGKWVYFTEPTPGEANTTNSFTELLDPPEFSHAPGFYSEAFQLTITHDDPNAIIIYTLDGSEPDIQNLNGVTYSYLNSYRNGPLLQGTYRSEVFESPIVVENRNNKPNRISAITTTADSNPGYVPVDPVKKAVVIKAKAYTQKTASTVSKATYFISDSGEFDYSLPIISLSLDEDKLYDYHEGIYVPGVDNVTSTGALTCDWGNYNRRGRETEKKIHMQYFENRDLMIDQGLGMRIHGNCSRMLPFKSMRLYARNVYDSNNILNYPFFEKNPAGALFPDRNEFKRILLRAPNFSDMVFSRLYQSVYEGIGGRIQPAIKFLNGEYWGISFIRDRLDHDHFANYYDLTPDNVIQINIRYRHEIENIPRNFRERVFHVSNGVSSDLDLFYEMRGFIINNDMSVSENYSTVMDILDVNSYIDHLILKIFAGDDHYAPEFVFWKARERENDHYGDGRWRVTIKDFDSTLKTDNFLSGLATGTHPRPFGSEIFQHLLQNKHFEYAFLNRLADLLNTHFLPDRFQKIIENSFLEVSPYWDELTDRWNNYSISNPDSPFKVEKKNQLISWSNEHPGRLRKHAMQHFHISSTVELTVNVNQPKKGNVLISTIDLTPDTPGVSENPYAWTGTYFSGIPIVITAQPKSGYLFSHWTGSKEGTEPSIKITPDGNIALTAHFVENTGVPPNLEPFTFTNQQTVYEEHFTHYRGSNRTMPEHMFVMWDENRLANPFTGVGNVNTGDPELEYGNFTAYTADGKDFSFGIRERAPYDLRDARLYFAFTNNTDKPVSEFYISYDVEAWFIGDRRNRIRLKYDDAIISDERFTFETDLFSTDNPSKITTPNTKVNGALDENRTRVSGHIDITKIDNGTGVPFQPVAPGDTAYFRWQFSNTTADNGSLRSGLAVNNISVHTIPAGEYTIAYRQGWNIAGVPVHSKPITYHSVFNTISAPPLKFISEYVEAESLFPGIGYWVHLAEHETVNFTGDELNYLKLDLKKGWNLLSGPGQSVQFAAIDDSEEIINSAWYGFDKAYYVTTKIEPGKGYWVRASRPGDITFGHSSPDLVAAGQAEKSRKQFSQEEEFIALHFIAETDTLQVLWFDGHLPDALPNNRFDMPPAPPKDAFDARFVPEESRLSESAAPQISIQLNEQLVEVYLHAPGWALAKIWEIVQFTADGMVADRQTVRHGEAVALYSADVTGIDIVPKEENTEEDPDDPTQFVLEQNFPNPFNSRTQIRYQLPETSEVRLNVYEMTGRRVATLVNGNRPAGTHTVTFNAGNLSSGVYIYRLQAGEYLQMKRLTVIK